MNEKLYERSVMPGVPPTDAKLLKIYDRAIAALERAEISFAAEEAAFTSMNTPTTTAQQIVGPVRIKPLRYSRAGRNEVKRMLREWRKARRQQHPKEGTLP